LHRSCFSAAARELKVPRLRRPGLCILLARIEAVLTCGSSAETPTFPCGAKRTTSTIAAGWPTFTLLIVAARPLLEKKTRRLLVRRWPVRRLLIVRRVALPV